MRHQPPPTTTNAAHQPRGAPAVINIALQPLCYQCSRRALHQLAPIRYGNQPPHPAPDGSPTRRYATVSKHHITVERGSRANALAYARAALSGDLDFPTMIGQ